MTITVNKLRKPDPQKRLVHRFKSLGFDRSHKSGATVRVQCSECEALVINGWPTHETGCPNAMHECEGCNTLLPANQRYCGEDCAS